jgi:hypothetical protein
MSIRSSGCARLLTCTRELAGGVRATSTVDDPFESRLLGYARYLLATDRWNDLALYHDHDHDHERGNSRTRTVPIYRRVQEVYKPPLRPRRTSAGSTRSSTRSM